MKSNLNATLALALACTISITNAELTQRDILARSISTSPAAFAKATYDYVVIGAGTAGLTVAARLSQSGKYTVAVIEAGISGLGDPIIDTPGDYGADVATKYDCQYILLPILLHFSSL